MVEEKKRAHTLTIDGKIKITGVENVLTMSEKEVEILLSDGVLTLNGDGFSPLHLNVEEGVLILAGNPANLRYSGGRGKESLWKKLLK